MLLKILGYILLATPLMLISACIIKLDGWKMFFVVWGVVFILIAPVILGLFLLFR